MTEPRKAILLLPDQGRTYSMGPMTAIFKADGAQTRENYSVSEWWLEPLTRGPGVHCNPEDHVFYVIEGVLTIFLDDQWFEAPRGSCVTIPGGVPHDFQNQGSERAGFLVFNSPGGFEEEMKDIERDLASTDLRI